MVRSFFNWISVQFGLVHLDLHLKLSDQLAAYSKFRNVTLFEEGLLLTGVSFLDGRRSHGIH